MPHNIRYVNAGNVYTKGKADANAVTWVEEFKSEYRKIAGSYGQSQVIFVFGLTDVVSIKVYSTVKMLTLYALNASGGSNINYPSGINRQAHAGSWTTWSAANINSFVNAGAKAILFVTDWMAQEEAVSGVGTIQITKQAKKLR